MQVTWAAVYFRLALGCSAPVTDAVLEPMVRRLLREDVVEQLMDDVELTKFRLWRMHWRLLRGVTLNVPPFEAASCRRVQFTLHMDEYGGLILVAQKLIPSPGRSSAGMPLSLNPMPEQLLEFMRGQLLRAWRLLDGETAMQISELEVDGVQLENTPLLLPVS